MAIAAALALACVYALASLWLPFGWDHGMMASAGEALARGALPYRDSWEVKGPLAFVPFAFAQLIVGNVMWGVRLIELAILVPALVVLHRTVAAHTSVVIGAATSIGLYLWLASAGWFFTGQPDVWAMALTSVAVCLVMPRDPATAANSGRFALVGILIGVAGLIKPVYLGIALAPLACLASSPGLTHRRRVELAALLAAGAAAPIILVVGYFVARGGLDALIEVQVTFNLGTYRGLGWTRRMLFLRLGEYLAQSPAAVLAPIIITGVWTRRSDRSLMAPLLAWLVAGVLALAAQGRLNAHHWFVLYPPVLVCAAFGLHALAQESLGGQLGKLIGSATALVFALLVAAAPVREVVRWVRHVSGTLQEDYYGHYSFHTYNAGDEVRAAQHIRKRTAPSDGVYIWGNDATVRYLAVRPNPTRFVYDLPLTTPGALYSSYREEMMRGLTADPPAYIVLGTPWNGRPKERNVSEFSEFKSFLMNRYALETTIGNLDLYRRVGHAAAGGATD